MIRVSHEKRGTTFVEALYPATDRGFISSLRYDFAHKAETRTNRHLAVVSADSWKVRVYY